MLLGQARGKVGSLVFSRLNGQQVTRSKAESVKNPRSDGQNVQRSIFASVNAFASSVRGIVDHSFQSVKEGSESVNRFVSINTKKLRELYLAGADVDIMPKGAGLPYANPFRMSQGSLGLQRLFVSSGTKKYFTPYEESDWEGSVESVAMMQALIPAFAPGCEFAVMKVYYNEEQHYHYVTYDRAVFLSSFEGIDFGLMVDANGINPVLLDMNKTTNASLMKLQGGSSGIKCLAVSEEVTTEFAGDTLVACAFIVSQKDSTTGKWLYTTSDMVCVEGYNAQHDIEAAVASYGNNSVAETTSDLYLQQSASENQDGGVTPMAQVKWAYDLSGAISNTVTDVAGNQTEDDVATAGQVQHFVINFPKSGNVIPASQIVVMRQHAGVAGTEGITVTKNVSGNTVVVEGTIQPIGSTLAGDSASVTIANANGQGVNLFMNWTAE